jgi:hypothetical protein
VKLFQRFGLFVILVTLGASAPRPARATAVLAFDLEALTRIADRVVVGEVLSVKSDWERHRRRIYTEIEIQVAEIWKGEVSSSRRIVIAQPGGRVGDIEMKVHGMASFRPGDRAVLFLEGSEAASGVVGLAQGMRPLTLAPAAQAGAPPRWMALGGDRSAAVLYRDGRLTPAPAEPALPLETLRERVRALVAR